MAHYVNMQCKTTALQQVPNYPNPDYPNSQLGEKVSEKLHFKVGQDL